MNWQKKVIANFCVEGGVVLDPFMGLGTTAVACVNTGRKFIGFELDDKYFEIAKQRIAEHRVQMDMFGKEGIY